MKGLTRFFRGGFMEGIEGIEGIERIEFIEKIDFIGRMGRMGRMGRVFSVISMVSIISVISIFSLTSCDVHEWPKDNYGEVPFVLNLDFSTALPLYREITYVRGGEEAALLSPLQSDVRYIISVCRKGTRDEVSRHVFTRPYDGELDYTTTLLLGEGEWDIYAWADYVDMGSRTDKFYTTADFSNITYSDRDNYTGSNDCRDAFRGSVSVDVVHPDRFLDNETLPSYTATADMQRPMGRYEVIATDVDDFLTRVATMRTRDGASDTRVDIADFNVIVRYNAFMPCSFNIFTDKPSDSWTGMSFGSKMMLADEGMTLAFDYVLVNGSETTMNINIEVYDKDGTMLSVTRGIEVPIVRSKLTIVKGEFLTSSASGGVTINPGYEDDYNIEIK